MPPKRPLPPHSPSSSSRPPPAPADVTRRLLQRFYRDVRVVADLVDPETRLVRADDSVDFRELVEGTVFASVEEGQLPKLSVSESSFGSVSMSEVRVRFPSPFCFLSSFLFVLRWLTKFSTASSPLTPRSFIVRRRPEDLHSRRPSTRSLSDIDSCVFFL